MEIEQRVWNSEIGWKILRKADIEERAQLVFIFGDYDVIRDEQAYALLKKEYPNAHIVGNSAGGAIHGAEINETSFVATALRLERTEVQLESIRLEETEDSYDAAVTLSNRLMRTEGLKHVMVLCDGLQTDGDALAKGFSTALPPGVFVTGGLAGDQEKFEATSVIANAEASPGVVAVVGFYGPHLTIGHGSFGGWDSFGRGRKVTRSAGNIIHEIDGEPALALYKRYLGDMAEGLPATALYFPLNLKLENSSSHVVRSVLAVNEEDESLIFGGDIPNGATVTLMKASINRLVKGAHTAAEMSAEALSPHAPELALLVSCSARKMVLKQRAEEETEAVMEALAEVGCMAGFYSFGEISPIAMHDAACTLHNQTMTITTFRESER